MVQSPNIPIPGGPDDLGNSTPRAGELPGRPLPKKRSWITGEGTWLSSPDDPTTEDRTWWQFGGEMAKAAFELTPAWQINEGIQNLNKYLGRPIFVNEMAHAIDGSTHNIFNVFSFGASDYVGATDSQLFQGWEWSWQRGLFTTSRELLIIAYTGSARALYSASAGVTKYAWGGVWIAGVGYDVYGAASSGYESYVAFRKDDIVGGLWHAGFSALSAFGVGASLKGGSSFSKLSDSTPRTGGFALPGGGWFRPDAKIIEQAIAIATSPTFIARAKALGFADEVIADLPARLRDYKIAGTQLTGGWADHEAFIIGRLGLKTWVEQRILHELGHVLDDLAHPGLFGKDKYTWREYFDTESIAYFTQYGRKRPGLAAFNATAQRFPRTANTIGFGIGAGAITGVAYMGYGIYKDWDYLVSYFLGEDDND